MTYSYNLNEAMTQKDLRGALAAKLDGLTGGKDEAVRDRQAVLAAVEALSDSRSWGQFTVNVAGHGDGKTLHFVIDMTNGDGASPLDSQKEGGVSDPTEGVDLSETDDNNPVGGPARQDLSEQPGSKPADGSEPEGAKTNASRLQGTDADPLKNPNDKSEESPDAADASIGVKDTGSNRGRKAAEDRKASGK